MKVYLSKKQLMSEALLNPKMLNTMVGFIRTEGLREEIWLRKCLRCDKIFPARGKFIRTCHRCRSCEGHVRTHLRRNEV